MILANTITIDEYHALIRRAKNYHPVHYEDVVHDLILNKENLTDAINCLKYAAYKYNSVILKDLTKDVRTTCCKICENELPAYCFKTVICNGLKYFRTQCRACLAKKYRDRYHNDLAFNEKIKLRNKERWSMPHVKEQRMEYLKKPSVVQHRKDYQKKYREENKEARAKYQQEKRDQILIKRAEWRERNREKIREHDRKLREHKRLSRLGN